LKYLIILLVFASNVFADGNNDIKVLPFDNLKNLSKSNEKHFNELAEILKKDLFYQYNLNKKYPRVAQMRQWQGLVVIKIIFFKDREPTAEWAEKSKYSVLNDTALSTALNAARNVKPDPKLFLSTNHITVLLPVNFNLE